MRRFLARAAAVAASFLARLREVVFPGAHWFQKVIPLALWATALAVSYWVSEKELVSDVVVGIGSNWRDRAVHMSLATALVVLAIGFWLAGGIGYAIAKTFRAQLVVPDSLELDEENHAVRLVIRCEGFGDIEPEVTVSDLRDSFGARVLPEAVVGRALEWTGSGGQRRIVMNEESAKQSVTVFDFADGCLRLYIVGHRQPIDHRIEDAGKDEFWIKTRVWAKGCGIEERWYRLAADDASAIGYRPSKMPDPPPPFCK